MDKSWKVKVIKTVRYEAEITVEANDWRSAREAAFKLFELEPGHPLDIYFDTREMIQLGEPWAYSCGWYDLHGPGDVIVVERAYGNRFTTEDITLLEARLRLLGFPPQDSWNGIGASTVSFRCSGRKADAAFTSDQLATLLAPRP